MKLEQLIFILLLLASVSYAVPIAACGNLAAGTDYTLTNNILNYPFQYCFNTTGTDISFNCQGFTVDGTDLAGSYAFQVLHSDIEIYNCTLTDWRFGIVTPGATGNYSFHDIQASSNTIGNGYDIALNGINKLPIWLYNLNLSPTFASASTYPLILGTGTLVHLENSSIGLGTTGDNTFLSVSGTEVVMANVSLNYDQVYFTPGQTLNVNITDVTSQNALLLRAVNASSSTRVNFNYSVSSISGTNQYTNLTNSSDKNGYVLTIGGYANGFYSLSFTLPTTGGYGLVAALPGSGTSNLILTRFHVVDTSGTPLGFARVKAQIAYAGDWALGGDITTDSSGIAMMTIDSTLTYLMNISLAGYDESDTYIKPIVSDYYITLGTNVTTPGFNYPGTDIWCSILPAENAILNTTTNFTLTMGTFNNSLEWWGWYIYNGTAHYNASWPTYNVTNTTGGSLQAALKPFDVPNVTIQGFFKHKDFASMYNCTRTYVVYYFQNMSYNVTAEYVFNKLKTGQAGQAEATMTFIALIIAFSVASFIGRFGQFAGATSYVLVLAMFVGVGMVQPGFFFLLVAALFAIALNLYGGR